MCLGTELEMGLTCEWLMFQNFQCLLMPRAPYEQLHFSEIERQNFVVDVLKQKAVVILQKMVLTM